MFTDLQMFFRQVKIWFQNRRMKWKRTKKGGKGERKDGEDGEEGKQELDDEEGEDEEENIQVDSPGPDMDDLNSSSSVVNMQCSSSSPPQFEIKSETPEHHNPPTPALNPFYLPGKINPATFTSFASQTSFPPSFPSSPFPNHQLGLKPRDLREAFGLARRPDPEAEVAESR